MIRTIDWMAGIDRRLFRFVNAAYSRRIVASVMNRLTHAGGATFNVALCLALLLAGGRHWSAVALQSLLALVASHVPVAVLKRAYPRTRPYLAYPDARTCLRPLTDPSFPSGHTTAAFAVAVPFAVASPLIALIALPAAALIGLSRVCLGLHYPSDCAAGACLGTGVALVAFFCLG